MPIVSIDEGVRVLRPNRRSRSIVGVSRGGVCIRVDSDLSEDVVLSVTVKRVKLILHPRNLHQGLEIWDRFLRRRVLLRSQGFDRGNLLLRVGEFNALVLLLNVARDR